MSLVAMSSIASQLNIPSLVASSGVVALASLPWLEHAIVEGTIPFVAVKVLNCLLYAVNVVATSQPGRLDGGSPPEETSDKTKRTRRDETKEIIDNFSSGPRGRSLVLPAGWAFIIWAPIFLGEAVFCVSQLAIPATSSVATVLKEASGGFMISQVVQSLWAAAFRPKYSGSFAVYVSAFLLTGIAVALSRSHLAFTSHRTLYSSGQYWLYFLPMSLHFGWTTAASLVNWNGSLAAVWQGSPWILALAGHGSVVIATAVGVGVTWLRQAPVYGGVIAWALTACSAGIHKRIQDMQQADEKDKPAELMLGAAVTQKWLCLGGAILSGLAAVVVTWSMRGASTRSKREYSPVSAE